MPFVRPSCVSLPFEAALAALLSLGSMQMIEPMTRIVEPIQIHIVSGLMITLIAVTFPAASQPARMR